MLQQVLDPNVAYLLLVAGMLMAILALFSPGTGLLEAGALFALTLAGFGILGLSVNVWALIILIVSVAAFGAALRFRRHWIFLAASLLALIGGSIFLFAAEDGSPAVNPILAVVTSVMALGILWIVGKKGLEAVTLRPTHDLARLVGKIGEARTNIREEGTVYIDGEEWTARSSGSIPLGSKVRVVGRDGLTLIVEPYRTDG